MFKTVDKVLSIDFEFFIVIFLKRIITEMHKFFRFWQRSVILRVEIAIVAYLNNCNDSFKGIKRIIVDKLGVLKNG